MRHLLLITTAMLPAAAYAASDSWVEFGSEVQHFDNGQDDSLVIDLAISQRNAAGRTLYGGLSHQDRFGRRDLTATAGAYLPVTATGKLHLEVAASPSPELRPRHSTYTGWYQTLPDGWTLEPGVQSTHYQDLRVDRYSLGVERYLKQWRLYYNIAEVRLAGSGELSQRAQLDYYYGEDSRIGIGHAWGNDQESLPAGVISTPVRSYSLAGQHRMTPRISLLYAIQDTEQGSLYRQTGGRLGIRYAF